MNYNPSRKHKRPQGAYEEPHKHYSHIERRCGDKCVPMCARCVHYFIDYEESGAYPDEEWCLLRNEYSDAYDMCDSFSCIVKQKRSDK